MLDRRAGHRVGGERFVAAAECGDTVQHEHEVIEQPLDVELDAWRRQVELVGAHAGDDRLGDLRRRWRRAGVGRVVVVERVGQCLGGHEQQYAPSNRPPAVRFLWEDLDMRADRLVAILLMLQTKGQVTAAEVGSGAGDLGTHGPAGSRLARCRRAAGLLDAGSQRRLAAGWATVAPISRGLTSAEAQALFLLAGPRATTPELRAALRKLVRALPEPFRERAEAASAAVVHDATGWSGVRRRSGRHRCILDAVQSAVIAGRQIVLGYVAREGAPSTRTVHPLGLATKGGSWYLVAETDAGRRTFRVDRIQSVEVDRRSGRATRRASSWPMHGR